MIERRGANAHAHVGRSLELRHWQIIAHRKLVQAAVSGNRQAFHEMGTVIFRSICQTHINLSPAHGSMVGVALLRR